MLFLHLYTSRFLSADSVPHLLTGNNRSPIVKHALHYLYGKDITYSEPTLTLLRHS
ncbi:MAG: hypothetical protein IJS73_00500 [Paludibacteraceae bacterium]|nr:hypothetical protein [Paludibacteraceae bacterium]